MGYSAFRNPDMPSLFSWRRLGCALALLMLDASTAQAQFSREYDLKAVFIYNLSSFVDWPASAFESENSPFVIGILGSDPFGAVLDEVVKNEFRGKRPFVVTRFLRSDDFSACHILFVSQSESRRFRDIFRRVEGLPILTVGDFPGFAERGGMIGFGMREDRLELFVNPSAVSAVEISLSSKLLEVAQVIDTVAVSP